MPHNRNFFFHRKAAAGACLLLCLTPLLSLSAPSTPALAADSLPAPAAAGASSSLPDLSTAEAAAASSLPVLSAAEATAVSSLPVSGADADGRVTWQEGFFYEPLSEEVKARITGISYGEGCIVPYEDLRYLNILYVDFHGETQVGEIICNQAIAQDLVEIFYELYLAGYPLESVRLVDEFGGDDTLSMEHNNTSCFNFRVVDGTSNLSKHAYGLAIDINPLYNPYVTWPGGKQRVSPAAAAPFADRSLDFPNKIDEDDLCYQLFAERGFTWGGHWRTMKDYQHFQKALPED